MQYDLAQRTKCFSQSVIKCIGTINVTVLNKNIISQLLRSGTSIGANYREANAASSKKDFRNKIHICLKEAQETQYWIELLAVTNPEKKIELKKLWLETRELILIFNRIAVSSRH
jgi:four helix bundle protein